MRTVVETHRFISKVFDDLRLDTKMVEGVSELFCY